jgi:hypothetical protein
MLIGAKHDFIITLGKRRNLYLICGIAVEFTINANLFKYKECFII